MSVTTQPRTKAGAAPAPTVPVAVGFCRCSTDMQDHSIEDQEAEVRGWCKANAHALVAMFKDQGISGSELDRPGLNGLKAFLQSSETKGTLVVWKRDRLVRPEDPLDGLLLERDIRAWGWKIHYLAGSNIVGNSLVDSIMGLVEHHASGEYLRKLAQDSLRGQFRRVLAGDLPGGKTPFGYLKAVLNPDGTVNRTVPRNKKFRKQSDEVTKLVLGDAVEVDTVRWIFTEYGTGLRGYSVLAKELNGRGVLAPNGGKWVAGSIREVLIAQVYAGDIVWNKETQSRFFRLKKDGALAAADQRHLSRTDGKKTGYAANAVEDRLVVKDHHPAIVSREVFDRAQEVMNQRKEAQKVGGGDGGLGGHWTDRCYVLTGLVHCANCGHRMTAIPTKSRGKIYRRYLCQGWMKARVCNPFHVNADRLERAVAVRIRDHFGWDEAHVDEFRARVLESLRASPEADTPLAAGELARERAKLVRQVEQSVSNLAFVPPEVAGKLGGHIAGWQARIAEIDKQVAADEQRRLDRKSHEAIADEVVALLGQVDRVIAGAPRDEVREFFVRAVERIELHFTTTDTKAAKARAAAAASRGAQRGADPTAHVTATEPTPEGANQTDHVTTRRRHRLDFGTIKTNAPLASQRGVTSTRFSSGGERAHCATTASRVTC